MKELTRITTVQITKIIKDHEKGIDYMTSEGGKAKYAENLQHRLDIFLNADDVNVTDVDVVVRDMEE